MMRRSTTFTQEEVAIAMSLAADWDPADPQLSNKARALIFKVKAAREAGESIFIPFEEA